MALVAFSPAALGAGQAPAKASSGAAFKASLDQLLPVSPGQIRAMRKREAKTQAALHGRPQSLLTRSISIKLEPGQRPKPIYVVDGYVASLTVVDSTGAPWPISSFTVGNPKWFDVSRPKELKPGNLLTISTLEPQATSDLIITLKGKDNPFVIELVGRANQDDAADAQVAVRIAGSGPQAKQPVIQSSVPSPVTDAMLGFLYGTPPHGASRMKIANADAGDLWSYKGRLYLRTAYAIRWPAFLSDAQSGGMHLYVFPPVPAILLSNNGQTVHITVPGGGSDGE